jgi:hypothetical protein
MPLRVALLSSMSWSGSKYCLSTRSSSSLRCAARLERSWLPSPSSLFLFELPDVAEDELAILLLVNFLFVPLNSGSFDWPRFSLSDENERTGDAGDSDVTQREVSAGLEFSVLEEVVCTLSRAIFTAIHARRLRR